MTTLNLTYSRRRRLAQIGLVARGILYALVGLLALQVAFQGGSSAQASQSGALQALAQQPFGTFLVALIGVGLIGYSVWRFTQFLTEKGSEDSETKDAVMRASFVVRGVVYLGLAFVAFSTAFGSGGGGGGGGQQLTARIMRDVPGGVVLVALVGLILVAVGLYQAYQAYSDDFMEEMRQHEMTPQVRTWVKRIGVAGHAARSVVYCVIGVFIIRAALQFDPQEAKGLDGALQELASTAAGPWLLVAVALGLFLYGTYSIVRARYVDISE